MQVDVSLPQESGQAVDRARIGKEAAKPGQPARHFGYGQRSGCEMSQRRYRRGDLRDSVLGKVGDDMRQRPDRKRFELARRITCFIVWTIELLHGEEQN
ncbi:hypothetical protein ACRAVF_14500 [Bradyrhizobium oligotrophicum S58]